MIQKIKNGRATHETSKYDLYNDDGPQYLAGKWQVGVDIPELGKNCPVKNKKRTCPSK